MRGISIGSTKLGEGRKIPLVKSHNDAPPGSRERALHWEPQTSGRYKVPLQSCFYWAIHHARHCTRSQPDKQNMCQRYAHKVIML